MLCSADAVCVMQRPCFTKHRSALCAGSYSTACRLRTTRLSAGPRRAAALTSASPSMIGPCLCVHRSTAGPRCAAGRRCGHAVRSQGREACLVRAWRSHTTNRSTCRTPACWTRMTSMVTIGVRRQACGRSGRADAASPMMKATTETHTPALGPWDEIKGLQHWQRPRVGPVWQRELSMCRQAPTTENCTVWRGVAVATWPAVKLRRCVEQSWKGEKQAVTRRHSQNSCCAMRSVTDRCRVALVTCTEPGTAHG